LTIVTLIANYSTVARKSRPAAPDLAPDVDDVDVDKVFGALADPTRRAVVELLVFGARRAGDLADAAGTSRPTMSRHLKVLLDAGVVEDERPRDDARTRVFRIRPASVTAVQAWLDQIQAHWNEQLQSFKAHVERRKR
jgi:DNA-binding transcriptional ArsR family regulator